MANLNINDIFWIEITGTIAKLGNENEAVGMAIRWFRYSQEKHKQGKLVSEEEFKENGFSEVLVPRFARRRNGGYECIGAEKHFSWLKSKSESGAEGGRASVVTRRKKSGTAIPEGASNSSNPKQTEAPPKQTEAAEPIPIPLPDFIPLDSGNPIRERGARRIFETVEALREAIPLHTRAQFEKWYPDKLWLDLQYERAFSKATSDEATAPRTAGAWMKYLHTWLEMGWQTKAKLGPIKKQLKDLELV